MRRGHYAQLIAIARRCSQRTDEAEDIVQDALVEALKQGRSELGHAANMRWIVGVIRNRARMHIRSRVRGRLRDGAWQAVRGDTLAPAELAGGMACLENLPRTLKSLLALVLSGHDRREIAHLLRISDDALRQRIVALKRELARQGAIMPHDDAGFTLGLSYGRIRLALGRGLDQHGGFLASHDPDGHLFFVRRSQNR